MTLKGKGGDRRWIDLGHWPSSLGNLPARVKLGQVLTRTVRAHLFESKSEAQAFHASVGEG